MNYETIPKEILHVFHFAKTEVLSDPEKISHRKMMLQTAVMLGNDFKQKVKIIFATTEGIKAVETTLWAMTDSHVEIKSGVDIPIHSIYEVIL